ncbi:MAG TPA: ABC transporter permease, partial [Vicinamibacterales bacterium]|nr:ABC transporter permease [Vicinamibacterales bacterium]
MSAGELWRRLQYLTHRSRFDRELREEMAAHQAMKLEDEPSFGNERRLREDSHDVWGWSWLDRLLQDLTFAQRLLRRSPVFTITAIAVLAIGLGVSLAGIQILDAAAFKPLPVKEPDTLVRFTRRGLRGSSTSFSYAALTYYAEHNTVLAAAMGIMAGDVTLGDDPTRHETVQFVTSNYLEEIGATARLGRILDSAQDDAADAEPAIVLSSRVWRDRFGADPAIVGRTVRVNDHLFVVVGVTAETLVGISEYPAGAWMPISRQTVAFPGSKALTDEAKSPIAFFARLKPGVSENSAEDALRVTAASLRAAHPDAAVEGEWLDAGPAGYYLPLNSKTAAGIAVVATFFLLFLMATCANLGTLMLSRAVTREREMAIRVAVGATSRRILRQLLTESCVLGALGAAAGMWVSVLIGRLLLRAVDAPAFLEPRLDARVLSATVGLTALATIAFGLAPALHVVRPRRARPRSSNVFV